MRHYPSDKNYKEKALFLLIGLAAAVCLTASEIYPQTPGPIHFSPGVGDGFFGRALSAGDFNGDGYPDLLVGAPGNLGEDTTGINPAASIGRAYIYYGPDFSTFLELTNPTPLAPTAFGWAVTAAKECAVAGITDAIVTAPLAGTPPNLGIAFRYSVFGGADPVATLANPDPPGDTNPDRFGVSVASARVSIAGPAFVAFGTTGYSLPLVDYTGRVWRGSCTLTGGMFVDSIPFYCIEPNYGSAVAMTDLEVGLIGGTAVGLPFASRDYSRPDLPCFPLGAPQGRAHWAFPVSTGGPMWYELYTPPGDFGLSVATGRRLYESPLGYPDTAVGAPFSNEVYLFNGNLNNPYGGPGLHPWTGMPSIAFGEPSQILTAPFEGGHFGRSVVIAQLNPFSTTQGVVVGAPFAAVEGLPRGKVYVFDGSPDFTLVAELGIADQGSVLCGENRFFGWSVAVDDFNLDGWPDIAAGHPCAGLTPEGAVSVFFGCAAAEDCATGVCEQGYCRPAPAS